MHIKIHELEAKRAKVLDQIKTLAEKDEKDFTAEDQKAFDALQKEDDEIKAEIGRKKAYNARMAESAQPAPGQSAAGKAWAASETDPYVNNDASKALGYGKAKSLVLGGMIKMFAAGKGDEDRGRRIAEKVYGEGHPVTKALTAAVGVAGGFFVPPDYVPDYVELLRAKAVLRAAGPRVLPMGNGTLRLPAQTAAASASYGAEDTAAGVSQPATGALVAVAKKLTGLVPISNSLLRYADPAIDAFVRYDLVKVNALREDLAFILGDGTQDTPRGFLSFANAYAIAAGGSVGSWSTSANSTLAVGGNFITSNATFTFATVAAELSGAAAKLDRANVPADKRAWFMHPDIKNYLYDLQNSLGEYIYRDELNAGKLRNCPVFTTTQIPHNYWDAAGSNKDLSFIFFAEMTEAMLFDSLTLQLAVSTEGSYKDAGGNQQNAFQNDETLLRSVAEHDFLMRHDQAVAVIQACRWAPTLQ